jgi:mitochondrial fission protein ELM1
VSDLLIISDGKPGHRNQSLGLAQALQRCKPSLMLEERAPLSRMQALGCLLRRAPSGAPRPRLLIGAGHGTHLTLLALKRWYGVPAVVLMKPTLPTTCFDLCLIPAHDQPRPAPNVERTMGALNRMYPGDKQTGRGLILIGGPSKNSGWVESELIAQLRALTRTPFNWRMTTSRRTPDSTLALLQTLPGVELVPAAQTPDGWVAAELAEAEQCWVTEDSVSMIYEALSAGCGTGLLPVPWLQQGRLYRGLEQLAERQLVCRYREWSGGALKPPPEKFNEAERCAALIVDRGWV